MNREGFKFETRTDLLSVTHGASRHGALNLVPLLEAHFRLEQCELSSEDHQLNVEALQTGDRIFTSHILNGEKLYIITEAAEEGGDAADRKDCPTTIMTAMEY